MYRAVGCRRRLASSCCSARGSATVQLLSCTSCTIKTMFPLYPSIHTHTPDLLSWCTYKQWLISLYSDDKAWILVNNSQCDYGLYGDQFCLHLVLELHLEQPHCIFHSLQTRLQPVWTCLWFWWLVPLSTVTCLSQALCVILNLSFFSWQVKSQKTWVRMSDWFRVCVLCCWEFVSTIMTTAWRITQSMFFLYTFSVFPLMLSFIHISLY